MYVRKLKSRRNVKAVQESWSLAGKLMSWKKDKKQKKKSWLEIRDGTNWVLYSNTQSHDFFKAFPAFSYQFAYRLCQRIHSMLSNKHGWQRMKVSRFCFVVYLQLLFLFVDLFINSFGELFRTADVVLLVLYMWVTHHYRVNFLYGCFGGHFRLIKNCFPSWVDGY